MFTDRHDAAASLVPRLHHLRREDTVVLAVPCGGVPIAADIAGALNLPLDVVVVRKVGLPGQPELAMAAVGEASPEHPGIEIVNERVVRTAEVEPDVLRRAIERERLVVAERAERLRRGEPRTRLTGRTALLVDDGVATGASMQTACLVVRAEGAGRIVLATPVASLDALAQLRSFADEIVCLATPHPFATVGSWYADYPPVSEDEAAEVLSRLRSRSGLAQ